MDTEALNQKLIEELNENSILMYADRQKFKAEKLPMELLQRLHKKYKRQKQFSLILIGILLAVLIIIQFAISSAGNTPKLLQTFTLQFMPLLGIFFFQFNFQNYGKRIFVIELLMQLED
jgi:hypothetical protein